MEGFVVGVFVTLVSVAIVALTMVVRNLYVSHTHTRWMVDSWERQKTYSFYQHPKSPFAGLRQCTRDVPDK